MKEVCCLSSASSRLIGTEGSDFSFLVLSMVIRSPLVYVICPFSLVHKLLLSRFCVHDRHGLCVLMMLWLYAFNAPDLVNVIFMTSESVSHHDGYGLVWLIATKMIIHAFKKYDRSKPPKGATILLQGSRCAKEPLSPVKRLLAC